MSWKIDTSHSHISFTVRHMMITNVRGSFDSFNGTIEFDEANPAKTIVDVEIDAVSINTKDERRDGHLRSADFFDAANFPKITFKGKRVQQIDSHHAKLVGDLTIRDVTKEVTLEVEYTGQAKSPWGMTSAGFSAETRINRKDWNLTWNQALETGGVLVGDEIKLNLEVEIVKQPESQAAQA